MQVQALELDQAREQEQELEIKVQGIIKDNAQIQEIMDKVDKTTIVGEDLVLGQVEQVQEVLAGQVQEALAGQVQEALVEQVQEALAGQVQEARAQVGRRVAVVELAQATQVQEQPTNLQTQFQTVSFLKPTAAPIDNSTSWDAMTSTNNAKDSTP